MKTEILPLKRTKVLYYSILSLCAAFACSLAAFSNTEQTYYFPDSTSGYEIVTVALAPSDFINNFYDANYSESTNSMSDLVDCKKALSYNYEVYEGELPLEDWMLDANNSFWYEIFNVDCENEIELEDWMMDSSDW